MKLRALILSILLVIPITFSASNFADSYKCPPNSGSPKCNIATPTPTLLPTPTPVPTPTVLPTPTPTPIATPTPTPVVTPTPTPPPSTTYTFDEEFTGPTLNLNKWVKTEWPTTGLSTESDNSYSLVAPPDGTAPMARIVNNQLMIRCERGTTPSGRAWRSGAIDTRGTFQQLYGNFQARIKYPKGQGLWPAFWLLEGNNTSGRRPELDILEAYPFGDTSSRGGGPTEYAFTNHYRDSSGIMQAQSLWIKSGIDLTADYHIFEMEWRPNLLIVKLDGIERGRITSNVPATPMFIILDHVVGGWAGVSDATTPSPSDMFVDWVRVTP